VSGDCGEWSGVREIFPGETATGDVVVALEGRRKERRADACGRISDAWLSGPPRAYECARVSGPIRRSELGRTQRVGERRPS
jgi:hypothetical protein